MTDRIRSSRRLIIIGAALLVAAAVALVLGVVPPFRFDTFPGVDPVRASRTRRSRPGSRSSWPSHWRSWLPERPTALVSRSAFYS